MVGVSANTLHVLSYLTLFFIGGLDNVVVGDEYMTITKIVPIYDILAINFDLKTKTLKNLITYDPNKDDPLNKYTYEDKHGGLRPP